MIDTRATTMMMERLCIDCKEKGRWIPYKSARDGNNEIVLKGKSATYFFPHFTQRPKLPWMGLNQKPGAVSPFMKRFIHVPINLGQHRCGQFHSVRRNVLTPLVDNSNNTTKENSDIRTSTELNKTCSNPFKNTCQSCKDLSNKLINYKEKNLLPI